MVDTGASRNRDAHAYRNVVADTSGTASNPSEKHATRWLAAG